MEATFLAILPQPSGVVTGLEYKEGGVQASWFYLAHLFLSLGHGVTVAAQEGGVYSRRYIYIIYILLTC